MQTIITTILHRPYVFAFLISFIVIGFLNRGFGRTFLFLVLGYFIAFLSEFSSIRNGFPYGMYHYVYENLEGELLWGGVPVWDSLSYSFLAYAGYEMADYFLGGRWKIPAAGLLMVLLDVVADPLAVRGDRWFLGRIFFYPENGPYFGVPLSNFAGWFLVALTIFTIYSWLEKRFFQSPPPRHLPLLGPLFYWGIVAFNLVITFWIGEVALGLTGLAIHALTAAVLVKARSR